MQCLSLIQQLKFKQIDPKEFDLKKYAINSSKGCILEVDFEYPKELREFHNDYFLAPNKAEIKREMLSEYQLKIADLYNIPISKVKKLVPNCFHKEKYVLHYENIQLCVTYNQDKTKTINNLS